MIEISIPIDEFEFDLQNFDLNELKKKQGIYKFYSENGTLLYIGKSTNINKRIHQHLSKKSHIEEEYISKFRFLKGFYEESELDTSLYEVFMINTLRPSLNIDSVYVYRSRRQTEKQAEKHLERIDERKEYERRKRAVLSCFSL
jgi:excinuclease UvrABC nuclease subunit